MFVCSIFATVVTAASSESVAFSLTEVVDSIEGVLVSKEPLNKNLESSSSRDFISNHSITSFAVDKSYSPALVILGSGQYGLSLDKPSISVSETSTSKVELSSDLLLTHGLVGRMKPFCSITNYSSENTPSNLSKLAFGLTFDKSVGEMYSISLSQYVNYNRQGSTFDLYITGDEHIGVEVGYEVEYLDSEFGLTTYVTSSKKTNDELKEALVFVGGVYRF